MTHQPTYLPNDHRTRLYDFGYLAGLLGRPADGTLVARSPDYVMGLKDGREDREVPWDALRGPNYQTIPAKEEVA